MKSTCLIFKQLYKKQPKFMIFVIGYFFLLLFDYVLRFELSFVEDIISCLPLFLNNIIHLIIMEVSHVSLKVLTSCSIFTAFFSQVLNVIVLRTTANIYDINHKVYSRFYFNDYRIYTIIVFTTFSIILNSHSTLIWNIVAFLIYAVNIIVKYDYTQHILFGVEKGYFKAIEIMIRKEKNNMKISENTELLLDVSSHLLERLIIYSYSSNAKDQIYKYDSIQFNLRIMKSFYKKINKKNIWLFIKEIKKSIDAFFYTENVNYQTFNNYIDSMIEVIMSGVQTKDSFFCTVCFTSLFFSVLENKNIEKSQKESVLLKITECMRISNEKIYSTFQYIIYLIFFWKYSIKEDIFDEYRFIKPYFFGIEFELNNFNDIQIREIFDVCNMIISNLMLYPDSLIGTFKEKYLIIIKYIDNDFLGQYYLYEMEVK